jgi:hypothetical protein
MTVKGEVQKFEDAIDVAMAVESDQEAFENITKLQNLYTQPFKPELIEVFEGMSRSPLDNELYYVDKTQWVTIQNKNVRTLSDFIDACINLDIKLKWRQHT